MSSIIRMPFRLIRGGRKTDAMLALPEPHGLGLIGVATLLTAAERPGIALELQNINPYFEFLAGKTLGVYEKRDLTTCCAFHQPHYRTRWPSLEAYTPRRIALPCSFFGRFRSAASMGPFLDEEHRQRELLRECLLADRIFKCHEAIVQRPRAIQPGLDREERLHWLASREGHNRCDCGQEIDRSAFLDEECLYLGPFRQRCLGCITIEEEVTS
ncbi:MAG: hypothetical protein V1895_00720 [Parcubacteria group bacterium]